MLKKITSILLTILYLTSNTGFAINLDYVEHIFGDEDLNTCDMEYLHEDNSSCEFYAYACESFLTNKTTAPLNTIYDFVNLGVKHNHQERTCESELLVLITNADVISNDSGNSFAHIIANAHIPVFNKYAHLVKLMNLNSGSSAETTKVFAPNTSLYNQPIYLVFQQLVLYS